MYVLYVLSKKSWMSSACVLVDQLRLGANSCIPFPRELHGMCFVDAWGA